MATVFLQAAELKAAETLFPAVFREFPAFLQAAGLKAAETLFPAVFHELPKLSWQQLFFRLQG